MAAPSDLPTGTQQQSLPWLFSPVVDLCTFLGSAAIALGLLLVGAQFGLLHDDTPEWMWVPAILMIDVAHVYATGFRVYFDRTELRRNPWLYGLAPLLAFLIGAAIYSESSLWFWRILAYLAVFHFVRQQYGWVALYRARGGETDRLGYWVDTAAIYLATIYPLVYWHAASPRNFNWFLEGDFLSLPGITARVFQVLYWIALGSYVLRAIYRGIVKREYNPGKDIVVATTALCWYLGIVALNSDYAFTVTNVIIHGIPYLVLVFWYRWMRQPETGTSRWSAVFSFLGIVWMLAYFEELLWDTGLWHERPWLFGSLLNLDAWESLLIPLLAVPQITHYILDGFIWKRKSNKDLASMVDH